jgi:class 3 adenylate cyclase/HAMP domain-containing protein
MPASIEFLRSKIQDLPTLQEATPLDFQLDNQRYFLKVSPLRDEYGLNWLIVVVVPEADFMDRINENTRNTFLLCLVALAIAIAFGMLTVSWITAPIQQITKASKAMADGDLNQHIQPSPIIEVDKLSSSFNWMTAQLKDSVEALRLANEELENRVEQRTGQLSQEKERSEQLLLNILPVEIADRLKRDESPTEHFEEVTILFADIVGFTSLSAQLEPMQLVAGLNQIFSAFDGLTEKYGLEKIKTIGDAYMVVGGLPIARGDHAIAIAEMALEMQAYIANMPRDLGHALQIRIGINTGPVIAGVIGIKKFIYDLWGDAVNVASRMESHGKPGYIQVTETTYNHLKGQYILEPRGAISVKGRGEMITYWLVGKKSLALANLSTPQ